MEVKKCGCCGFESDNYRLFIKLPDRHDHRHWLDKEKKRLWICRSEKKCIDRTYGMLGTKKT